MARILFIQPYDFPNFQGEKKRKRFFISRSQFEVGYQVPPEHDFFVLDVNLSFRQNRSVFESIKHAVCSFDPQVIFVTYPSFPQGNQIKLILRCLSKIGNTPVVVGGDAISLIEEAPLRWWPDCNIACCYKGFGSEVSAIIQNVTGGDVQEVPGLYWADGKSAQNISLRENLIDFYNPNDLYSAKGRLNFQGYLSSIKRYGLNPCAIVELTRGCLHRCSFCAINRKNYGFFSRSFEVVANEIEYLASLGVISFRFADPTFGLEKEKTSNLLEAMISTRNRYPRIKFEVTTRADAITRNNAQLFRKAGITRCDLGMETMSEKELASFHKDVKRETLQRAVGLLSQAGVEIKLFHITIPGRISNSTIEFLLKLSDDNAPFLVQSAYLRNIPHAEISPHFLSQDQKVFCKESDSIEQIMEWILVNLAFRSTNTLFHEPSLRDKLHDALSRGVDLKEFFDLSLFNGDTVLKLKSEFSEQKYSFSLSNKTPFMWCLTRDS